METLDVVLGLILIISFIFGLSKGFLKSFLSLIGLFLAVYIALTFSHKMKIFLERHVSLSEDLLGILAFLVVFGLVMVGFTILGRVLTKLAGFMMMGWLNRILGGVFSMVKYAFVVSVVFMFVNASEFYSILSEEDRKNSLLYNPIASLAPAVLPEIKKGFKEFDLENRMNNSIQKDSLQ